MRHFPALLVAGIVTAGPTPARPPVRASATAAPRVLVYYDMEGTSGINRYRQVLYPNPEYLAARKFLTGDVNAAIRGLKAGGAGEIVVTDAHGSGNSDEPDVLVDQLDKRATFLFRDKPFEPYMDAPDASYQAIVCVAMHARGNTPGFMAHTVTVEPTYRVNGVLLNETTIIAISAMRFGIPVIMVSGDNVLQGQIKEQFPTVEYALVKTAKGRADADLLPRPTAEANIEKAAKAAIGKLSSYKPFVMAKPFRFEVSYLNRDQADLAGSIPNTQRIDSLTLAYTTPEFAEGFERSSRMTGRARMDSYKYLMQAVSASAEKKTILNAFNSKIIGNWLEPEKMAKEAAAAPAAKKRYHGSS